MKINLLWLLVLFVLFCCQPVISVCDDDISRIIISDINGYPRFAKANSPTVSFEPRGFNFVRYWTLWHDIFKEGVYDPREVENELEELRSMGFNVIRLIVPPQMTEYPSHSYIHPRRLKNMYHFLYTARDLDLYVMICLYHTPAGTHYVDDPNDYGFGTTNMYYFLQSYIDGKVEYIEDIILGLLAIDDSIMDTVFSINIDNEAWVLFESNDHDPSLDPILPFGVFSGQVATPMGLYDMGDLDERQACMDDNMLNWCNSIVAAIKQIDPQILVAPAAPPSSAIAPWVYGLPENSEPPNPWEVRVMRNSIFCGTSCQADYIDIHLYIRYSDVPLEDVIDEQIGSAEIQYWDDLKPRIVGETGVKKPGYPGAFDTALEGALALQDYCALLCNREYLMNYLNFSGWLIWQWDTTALPGHWTGVEENYAIANHFTFDLFASPCNH